MGWDAAVLLSGAIRGVDGGGDVDVTGRGELRSWG